MSFMTLGGGTKTLAAESIETLAAPLRGTVLKAGGAGDGEARKIWDAMIDCWPALIVRCAGAADVIAAVHFAREHGLIVSVRGGGHNIAGNTIAMIFGGFKRVVMHTI